MVFFINIMGQFCFMIPKYGSIPLEPAVRLYGISSMFITPREWLNDWDVDFKTNTIWNNFVLKQDKYWMQLFFAPGSYEYEEDPKDVKGGTYYDIKAGGLVNTNNPEVLQILETLRYHECVTVLTDRRKQQRVVGSTAAAMVLSISNKTNNSNNGTQDIRVNLAMQSEDSPVFYTGTPVPSIGYFLQNGLGDLLDDGFGDHLLIR